MDYNYDDEYYYEQYGDADQYTSAEATAGPISTFLSEPQHILINEGDTFNIHCMVDQLGKRDIYTSIFYTPQSTPILLTRLAHVDVEEGGPAGGSGRAGADQQHQDVRDEVGGGHPGDRDPG